MGVVLEWMHNCLSECSIGVDAALEWMQHWSGRSIGVDTVLEWTLVEWMQCWDIQGHSAGVDAIPEWMWVVEWMQLLDTGIGVDALIEWMKLLIQYGIGCDPSGEYKYWSGCRHFHCIHEYWVISTGHFRFCPFLTHFGHANCFCPKIGKHRSSKHQLKVAVWLKSASVAERQSMQPEIDQNQPNGTFGLVFTAFG